MSIPHATMDANGNTVPQWARSYLYAAYQKGDEGISILALFAGSLIYDILYYIGYIYSWLGVILNTSLEHPDDRVGLGVVLSLWVALYYAVSWVLASVGYSFSIYTNVTIAFFVLFGSTSCIEINERGLKEPDSLYILGYILYSIGAFFLAILRRLGLGTKWLAGLGLSTVSSAVSQPGQASNTTAGQSTQETTRSHRSGRNNTADKDSSESDKQDDGSESESEPEQSYRDYQPYQAYRRAMRDKNESSSRRKTSKQRDKRTTGRGNTTSRTSEKSTQDSATGKKTNSASSSTGSNTSSSKSRGTSTSSTSSNTSSSSSNQKRSKSQAGQKVSQNTASTGGDVGTAQPDPEDIDDDSLDRQRRLELLDVYLSDNVSASVEGEKFGTLVNGLSAAEIKEVADRAEMSKSRTGDEIRLDDVRDALVAVQRERTS